MNRIFGIFGIILSLAPIQLAAASSGGGSSVGNGGGGIVCRNEKMEITYAQVFDLHERHGEQQFEYVEGDAESILKSVRILLTQVNEQLSDDFEDNFRRVERSIEAALLKRDRYLPLIGDFREVRLQSFWHCPLNRPGVPRYEQIVNYKDDDTMNVDWEIYENLSEVGKAALVVHETLYKLFREYLLHSNSAITRMVTSYLLFAATHPKESTTRELKYWIEPFFLGKLNPELEAKIAQKKMEYLELVQMERRSPRNYMWEMDRAYAHLKDFVETRENQFRYTKHDMESNYIWKEANKCSQKLYEIISTHKDTSPERQQRIFSEKLLHCREAFKKAANTQIRYFGETIGAQSDWLAYQISHFAKKYVELDAMWSLFRGALDQWRMSAISSVVRMMIEESPYFNVNTSVIEHLSRKFVDLHGSQSLLSEPFFDESLSQRLESVRGLTPLMFAAMANDFELATRLLQSPNIRVDQQTSSLKNDWTALDFAKSEEMKNLLKR